METEKCQRCGAVGQDRRTLWMACFYQMDELGLPFGEKTMLWEDSKYKQHFYTLRVCKGCRAEWMGAIVAWFKNRRAENLDENGNTSMSLEKYQRQFGGM